MASTLRARLLGRPAFDLDGTAVACPSRKAMCLAAYVLLTRASHSRAHLASLLWGGQSLQRAQGSLRVALTKLPGPLAATLEVTREEIGPSRDIPYETDVHQFLSASGLDDEHALRRATGLYGGDLLEGVEDDAGEEFCDWLLPERLRLREVAQDAYLKLARRLQASGGREAARDVAEAWLRRDPASEEANQLMMHILDGDQALAHFERYRRACAVASGSPPSEAMSALADRLRHSERREMRGTPRRLAAATSFFGRDEELAELGRLLADPACRLLTLHGLGGVGKTRLASALVDLHAEEFPDGVYLAPLDGVQSPRLFGQTLARACGLQAAGAASPLDIVAGFLDGRSVLLVLDNLEHLLAKDDPDSAALQVGALLASTSAQVKIVATSREPLGLEEESLYEVRGFTYPEGAAAGDSFAAVQFFYQRARQAERRFSLAGELPRVVEICRLLEGLPLGLELAASWVASASCADIAAGLRSRARELANRHANRAARHDSLGAVVAYSWERLTGEQREALRALAALRGSFSAHAAQAVGHASLDTLAALTDKSLLQRAAGDRWHMHEVVRQYAWDAPDSPEEARASGRVVAAHRRDAFFVDLLRRARARTDGPDEAAALAEIELDVANLREAWRSCAQAGRLDELEAAAPAWFDLLESRSFIAEGIAAAGAWLEAARSANPLATARALTRLGIFQRFGAQTTNALASLDEAIAILGSLESPRDLAQAFAARAFTLFLLGRLDDAGRDSAAAMRIAEDLVDDAILASGCRAHGLVLVQSGRREEGRDLQRRALEAALRVGKPSMRAAAHNNLALAENHLGNFKAAEAGYQAALDIWREGQMTVNVGRAMHNLGAVATRAGDHASALERYRAALEVLLKVGDRNLIALNLMSTGDALVRLGRPGEARVPLERSLRMAERDGHMLPALDAHIVLGQAAFALGEHRDSVRHLAAAIDGAREHHFANVLSDALVATASVVIALLPDERERALAWAGDVARLPATTVSVRRDAEQLLDTHGSRPAEGRPPRELDSLAAEAREVLARA